MVDRSDQSVPPLTGEDAELFEALPRELAELLYPEQSARPFRVTLVYPDPGAEHHAAAEKLQAAALHHGSEEDGAEDARPRLRTTFGLDRVEEFHELYHLAESAVGGDEMEILLNDRKVPLTRELWLPLLWSLRK